jgi:Predicted membrane protein (DUF2142)
MTDPRTPATVCGCLTASGRAALRAVVVGGPLLIALGVVVLLSIGDRPLLGTNRVGPASFFAVVPPGGQACTGAPERIPAGTGVVVVRASTTQAGPLDVALVHGRRVIARGRRTASSESGDTDVSLASEVRSTQRAVVCVRNGGIKPLGLAGTPAGSSPRVRIDRRPVDALIRLEYRGAHRVSWWSRIGGILDRFPDGKASFVGKWTLWLALGFVLAAIALGMVALWRPRRARTAAILCAAVAVLNALAFSITVPPFQVPDEESHTAYVQYLAETGKVPRPSTIGYSAEEWELLRVLQFTSTIGVRDNRPPHGPAFQAALRAVQRGHPSRVGTGDVAGAVVYPPTFYAAEAVPYWLSPTGSSLLDRLFWMRVLCALFAGVTVALAFGFLRELLPGTPWAWTTGALALALLPMFGFISGGVQNDAGLYLCSAGLFWAMARILRRGLTVRRGLALGGALVAGLLIKYTMVALAPAALATVLIALWRARAAGKPPPWRGALVAGAVVAVPLVVYALLSRLAWDRPLSGPLRASHPAVAHPEPATIGGQLSYAWELWLPRLPFMDDKFPGFTPVWTTWYRGGIGRFGWLDYGFPAWVAILLVPVVLAIVVFAVRAVLPRWRGFRTELGVYALAVLGLMLLLSVVGYRYELKYETYFQSPRYLFALLPLFAAAVAVAARGAGRRFGPAFGAAVVMIVAALMVFAQLATLERYYG